MKTNRQILTAIVESVYANGEAATVAVNVSSVKPTFLNTSKIESANIKPGFGHDRVSHAGANVALEFEMDLAGSGTLGTAPAFGPFLLACGFSQTIEAGVSVAYEPVSENADSLSMFYYHDGDLHQIKGARGDCTINLRQLDRPTIKFTFTGIYVPVVAGALPTPTFAPSAPVVAVSKASTELMTLDGQTLALSQCELTVGNTVGYRNLVNLEEVNITDRKSGLKLNFDRPNVVTKDWFDAVLSAETSVFNARHGKVAGNIIEILAGAAQPTEISPGDADGVAQIEMTARLLSPSGLGDDEFTLTFK
jgi:hypothetical protein